MRSELSISAMPASQARSVVQAVQGAAIRAFVFPVKVLRVVPAHRPEHISFGCCGECLPERSEIFQTLVPLTLLAALQARGDSGQLERFPQLAGNNDFLPEHFFAMGPARQYFLQRQRGFQRCISCKRLDVQ